MLRAFNGCAAAATHEDCTLARTLSLPICHHTPLKGAMQPYRFCARSLKSMLQVVQLDHLPFSWPASGALEVPTALLWMLTFQDNHGHLLGEHGPSMHTVLCTYLGRHA